MLNFYFYFESHQLLAVINPGPICSKLMMTLVKEVSKFQMYFTQTLPLFALKCEELLYRMSLVIRQIIFLPKQSQRSRSVLKDRSRSLGLFGKGIRIIAKFHRTDLII